MAKILTRPEEKALPQAKRIDTWGAIKNFGQQQGAFMALIAFLIFGSLRYSGFLTSYNIFKMLSYNSMMGFVALGMTFVIMTANIDLSVGSVVAMCSVIAALMSPHGLVTALTVSLAAGAIVGIINGISVAWLRIPPFIATLAMMMGARGMALVLSNNADVYASTKTDFTSFGSNYMFGMPISVLILILLYVIGFIVLKFTRFGRHVLAVGGNEEASRLMGLPVKWIILGVYIMSGMLAALAGTMLAAQNLTGIPTEGVGWELTAISAVVIGGTLLSGGKGSVATTLVGVILLGLIFNFLNFENGLGLISLTSFWQIVIRGIILLVVVLVQSRLAKKETTINSR